MLSFLPHTLCGVLSLFGYTLNTIILTIPLILTALLKFLIPLRAFTVRVDKLLNWIATFWISINIWNCRLFCKMRWDIRGIEQLKKDEWYLVLSNHQSWVDILVLQTVFNKKIPMLKFFLKKELIWVPFLGLAWWALDFPFMKRYTQSQIKANPKLKGKDIESTKKACRKFKNIPVSVMNFVEGTRFTFRKKQKQQSPFDYLLKPKAGGIAFVLGAMGEHLHKIIDVTIVYPENIPNFWDYICGKVKTITVNIEVLPITDELLGDYFNDPEYRTRFFNSLNRMWEKKDRLIESIKSEAV